MYCLLLPTYRKQGIVYYYFLIQITAEAVNKNRISQYDWS